MTKLLVSVRDVSEAAAALAGGADVIDVKEPTRGPLGGADVSVISAVVDFVAGRAPVSAAFGELVDVSSICGSLLPSGLSYAKVGLAGCSTVDDWEVRLGSFLSRLPQNVKRVAVGYADWEGCDAVSPEAVIRGSGRGQCDYFLLDTTDKTKCLSEHVSNDVLAKWVSLAANHGMKLVLAGSVTASQLDTLITLWRPALIAVRGAVCEGARVSNVSRDLVAELKEQLARVDSRLPKPD